MYSIDNVPDKLLHVLPRGVSLARASRVAQREPCWSREELAGRLTEVSGRGAMSSLTAAALLILDAQLAGEPCAWVTRQESTFFPPDFARNGIDLDALVVVFVTAVQDAARVSARLARSGAFGLVVMDLGAAADIPLPLQGRLSGLAIKHDVAIVLLTEKSSSAPSVGSMVSLRAVACRTRLDEARFRIRFAILKDKRRGPGWSHEEVVRGPAGLR
jgi:recombination protein RecA